MPYEITVSKLTNQPGYTKPFYKNVFNLVVDSLDDNVLRDSMEHLQKAFPEPGHYISLYFNPNIRYSIDWEGWLNEGEPLRNPYYADAISINIPEFKAITDCFWEYVKNGDGNPHLELQGLTWDQMQKLSERLESFEDMLINHSGITLKSIYRVSHLPKGNEYLNSIKP